MKPIRVTPRQLKQLQGRLKKKPAMTLEQIEKKLMELETRQNYLQARLVRLEVGLKNESE